MINIIVFALIVMILYHERRMKKLEEAYEIIPPEYEYGYVKNTRCRMNVKTNVVYCAIDSEKDDWQKLDPAYWEDFNKEEPEND